MRTGNLFPSLSDQSERIMLYIIRHGKTEWNTENRLQGRTDIPLNEEGIRMAEKAASEYADVHFDICFSSPLKRAYETARILLDGRDVPIETDDRLMEMCFGVYEGRQNYFEDEGLEINLLFKHPEEYIVPVQGGESLEALYKRTGEFLTEKVNPLLEASQDVLIVGHGAMNSSIVCQIQNIPVEKFWSAGIENCKLKKLV